MTHELYRDDAYRGSCTATVTGVDGRAVLLDQTVCYARAGGQPGDRGALRLEDGSTLELVDTVRAPETGAILHLLGEGSSPPAPGRRGELALDWARRYRLMRMHTCLHLLCRAVEAPVTGGQIDDGKGRLDFDAGGRPIDREAIEERLAAWIAADLPVAARWVEEAELDARPELVRTLSVRPPRGQGRVRLVAIEGIDLQACGGTHVRRTGEIGAVAVGRIESKGARNRRVTLVLA